MNDTHGQAGAGWYGFDLDGTLAVYDKWEGIDHIGAPVKPMVDLIRKMHAEGKVVKILTARVAPRDDQWLGNPFVSRQLPEYATPYIVSLHGDLQANIYAQAQWGARDFISDWCLKNLGFLPEITHEKDHLMLELYDDRVKQVVPNKGVLMEDIAVRETLKNLKLEDSYMVRFGSLTNGVILGWFTALALLIGTQVWARYHRTPADKALDNLRSAIIEVQEALK